MTHSAIIVDDEYLARRVLVQYLDEVNDFNLVAEMKSAEETMTWLETQTADLIFLDIHLPGASGLQFLSSLESSPLIIFATAYPEFAVQAFEVEAFDYLLKPIAKDRFSAALQKVRKYLSTTLSERQNTKWLNLKEGRRTHRVSKDDVKYLQAYGDYVRVCTHGKTYLVKDRLQLFIQRLPPGFLKIHRSYVINLDAIDFMEGNAVSIKGDLLPVSESYRLELNKVFGLK